MGTTWTVTVVTDHLPVITPSELRGIVDDRLGLVDRLMSTYRDDSELSRFNALRESTPFAIAAETASVVGLAVEIGELSDRAFDMTVGPLVEAWGFGPVTATVTAPSEAIIAELLEATGHQHLVFDPSAPSLAKRVVALELDLSAVAKGYAVDLVAEALVGEGYERYLVEVGGEVRVHGANPADQPWRLAVERPQEVGRSLHTVVAFGEGSLATSGDYRNYRDLEGVRVSHIIDPRSGRPITHGLASVSVVDPSCARADGLATALLVLGPVDGFALASALDLPALFLERDGDGGFTERATPRFDTLTVTGK